ncbi:SLOG family protein [Streptomyces sp. E11-3]|uniref:SLOG family protein n=1 Tax=Streptomyces sp. E11-3 TaxID=3110112 RepID=UPI00397F5529
MTTPYRVLVTGSRDWPTAQTVANALNDAHDRLPPGAHLVVVHGACKTGADFDAHAWYLRRQRLGDPVIEEPHRADWLTHGKAAGPIRNQLMVDLGADVCLAFIKDGSRGASHTAALAEAAGIPVRRWTT